MSEGEGTQEVQTGAQEETPVETPIQGNTNDSINASLDDVNDPDTLKKMIKNLRGEAAKNRKEKQAVKSELDEFNEWRKSQMSDLEREKSRADETEKKYKAKLAEVVALKYGVPDDLVEFITGDDEDEMEKKAEKLASRSQTEAESDTSAALRPQVQKSSTALPGSRGGAVGASGGSQSEAEWFKEWVSKAR